MFPEDFNDASASLFNSPRFSDLVIKCGSRQWHAHKAVLCLQSEWFAKACEGSFPEAQNNSIAFEEDPPDAVDAMLRYFYTGDYDQQECLTPAMVFNVRVAVTAEKYVVNKLCCLAVSRFTAEATEQWNTDAFAQAVEEAHSHCLRDPLRTPVFDIVALHAKELYDDELSDFESFRSVTASIPGFDAKVIKTVTHSRSEDKGKVSSGVGVCSPDIGRCLYQCPNCSQIYSTDGLGTGLGTRVWRCPACGTTFTKTVAEWQVYKIHA